MSTGRPLFLGLFNLVLAAGVVWGVFGGLPARWFVVDGVAITLSAVLALSGVALLAGARWGRSAARVAGWASLGVGITLLVLLILSASFLYGVYGATGRGGALICSLVMLLVLPYLVAYPVGTLLWLNRRT